MATCDTCCYTMTSVKPTLVGNLKQAPRTCFPEEKAFLLYGENVLPSPRLSLADCNPEALKLTAICLANMFLGSNIPLDVEEPFHSLASALGEQLTVGVVEFAFLVQWQRSNCNRRHRFCVDECGSSKGLEKHQFPPSLTTTAAASFCSGASSDNEDAASFNSVSSSAASHQQLFEASTVLAAHKPNSVCSTSNVCRLPKAAKELFVGSLSPAWKVIQVVDGTPSPHRLNCALHCEGFAISPLLSSASNEFSRFC